MANNYLEIFKNSPDRDNPDYIRGFMDALVAASHLADDLKTQIAGTPAFDELYDYVFALNQNLPKK